MKNAILITLVCSAGFCAENKGLAQMGRVKFTGPINSSFSAKSSNGQFVSFEKEKGYEANIPAGTYTLEYVYSAEFRLCRPYPAFDIKPGEIKNIELGGPYVPHIKPELRGRYVKLEMQLTGASGYYYQPLDRSVDLKFSVFKGDKQVGAGNFSFG